MEYFCPICGENISPKDIEFYKNHFICPLCSNKKSNTPSKTENYTIHLCTMCLSYIFNRNPKNALWKQVESTEIDDTLKKILKTELKLKDSHVIELSSNIEIPSKISAQFILNENVTDKLTILLKRVFLLWYIFSPNVNMYSLGAKIYNFTSVTST